MSQDDFSNRNASVLDTQRTIAACYHQHRARAARVLGVKLEAIQSIAPCTPLQEGMISKSLEHGGLIYFGSFRYLLSKDVELPKLQSAWAAAIDSIQILRTKFIQTTGGYVQVALNTSQLPWIEFSVSNVSEMNQVLLDQQKTWRQQNESDFMRPFEIIVIQTSERSFVSLNIFHGLYDGNSLALILAFVRKHYVENRAVMSVASFHDALPFGPISTTPGAKKFWTKNISIKHTNQSFNIKAQKHTRSISSKVTAALETLQGLEDTRKSLGTTHQAIMQACFAVVLRQYYAEVVPLGLVVSGRSIDFERADEVIGPLFNTIPFQIRIDEQDTWKSVVERCHSFNIAALSFQHTPLRDIQKWCKLPAGRHLFNVLFVFQKQTTETSNSDLNEIWSLIDDQSVADYPLSFEAELTMDGSIMITLVSQEHVADEIMLQTLAGSFHRAIKALIEDSAALISDTFENMKTQSLSNGIEDHTSTTQRDSTITTNFHWSNEAIIIRKEISLLSVVEEAGISENISIFELGLDSIDAIKLSSRLKKVNIGLSVSDIMRNPTILQMGERIANSNTSKISEDSSLLKEQETLLRQYFVHEDNLPQDVEDILPATPLQDAMFAEMINSDFTRYFNHDVLKLPLDIDVEKLEHAWKLIYERSPILRTNFHPVSEPSLTCSYAQVISKSGHSFWQERIISDDDGIQNFLGSLINEATQNKDDGNHFKITLVHTPAEQFLILSLPHALYDGWSLAILHHDVQESYHGRYSKPRPPSRRVLETIISASTREAREFWSDYLSDTKPCAFMPSSSKPTQVVHREEFESFLGTDVVRPFCNVQGITMQALGQTCWSLVLASLVQELEVVFGVVLSGRDTEEAQHVMFPTMNTVPFRLFLHGSRRDMLRYTHENMSEIRQFQHFPLSKAQALAKVGGRRLFESLFLYQVRPDIGDSGKLPLYESVGGYSDVEYPVCVEMETLGNKLVWRAACDGQLFSKDSTLNLLKQLDSTLRNLVKNPGEKTLHFEGDEVRVCDLPAFRITDRPQPLKTQETRNLVRENGINFSTTEQKIRTVLSIVSGTPEEQIGKESTLFHIGLDSISAIKVSGLLRKQSITLSVSNMIKSSTLSEMARFVDDQMHVVPKDESEESSLHPIKSSVFALSSLLQRSGLKHCGFLERNIEHITAATAGQLYMLSAWENSAGTLFHDEFKFMISESVAIGHISHGWSNFIAQNPILRTVFVATGEKNHPFAQMVVRVRHRANNITQGADSQESGHLTVRSLLDVPQTAEGTLTQPFVTLHYNKKTVDGKWELGLRIHHALYDGVSLPALLSELRDSIERFDAQTRQPNNHFPFADFAAQSYRARRSENSRSFWTQYLQGLSTKHPGSALKPTNTQRFTKYKPRLIQNGHQLVSLAQRNGIALPSIFLAAYAGLYSDFRSAPNLGMMEQEKTVVIGVYMANRDHTIEDLDTSPTVNLLPLRVTTGIGILESARMVQRDLARISEIEHVSVGLWEIAEWTGVKVDTFVNYLKLPGRGDEFRRDVRGSDKTTERNEVAVGVIPDLIFEVPMELRDNVVRDAYLVSYSIPSMARALQLTLNSNR
jgi:aryl carrier-like protein